MDAGDSDNDDERAHRVESVGRGGLERRPEHGRLPHRLPPDQRLSHARPPPRCALIFNLTSPSFTGFDCFDPVFFLISTQFKSSWVLTEFL